MDRRLVWYVRQIPHQQLQRMAARWQIDGDFSLATAEVFMVGVRGYRHFRIRQTLRIDQQMVMARLGILRSRRGNAYPPESEPDRDRAGYLRAFRR